MLGVNLIIPRVCRPYDGRSGASYALKVAIFNEVVGVDVFGSVAVFVAHFVGA